MTDPTPNPTPARDAVAIARNDLALRIAMDVLGDMGRADGLAEWLGRDGTDLGQAVARLIAAVRTDERAQLAVRATDQELGMVMDARRTIEAAIDQVYGRNGSTFIRAAVVKALDSILAALTAARERAIEEAAALCDTELKTILPKSDAAAEVLHLAGRIRALAGQKGET